MMCMTSLKFRLDSLLFLLRCFVFSWKSRHLFLESVSTDTEKSKFSRDRDSLMAISWWYTSVMSVSLFLSFESLEKDLFLWWAFLSFHSFPDNENDVSLVYRFEWLPVYKRGMHCSISLCSSVKSRERYRNESTEMMASEMMACLSMWVFIMNENKGLTHFSSLHKSHPRDERRGRDEDEAENGKQVVSLFLWH